MVQEAFMMPIAPLMLEHRLIERMIKAIGLDIRSLDETGKVEPQFIDLTVDFMKTYADRCHHGKEEDILFSLLAEKDISSPDRKTMNELIEDHAHARAMVNRLVEARGRYAKRGRVVAGEVLSIMKEIVSFYPAHIEREDRHFFIPCMEYFTDHEQDDMFEAFAEFDRKVIHEKYRSVVERIEGHGREASGLPRKDRQR
jgi:hemerythrin-like domain-containing protein